MTDKKTPHFQAIAYENDSPPANAPKYSFKKFKIDKDITLKAGMYDIDVFENRSEKGQIQLKILVNDPWINPKDNNNQEDDF